ncbi:hypothetical protein CFY91_06215 [Pseudomonas fluvialis]|uniref:Uncharacterized protein n=1 Tax=Pseudomonas fluvialis TaxID=1793966 RepID=A0ABQ2ATY8_9PSED|nr:MULTISPECIES: hypothetical protein [Pseudomonas]OXM41053.1 hypothetical protein CFY91_06215 [Pseudomonas fluvialis]PAV47282.1 hypothetical protein CK486_13980 [Pseudomonas sp. HAR-UPW-AIA-41]GGH96303.1 hypothetical protein GCM10007363_27570 [Pseudomonas fluvialis]
MKRLKNAVGRTDQHMHNIEDARLKGGTEPRQEPERKGVKWLKKVAKFAAKVGLQRLAVWILEDPESAWDYLLLKVGEILGGIAS